MKQSAKETSKSTVKNTVKNTVKSAVKDSSKSKIKKSNSAKTEKSLQNKTKTLNHKTLVKSKKDPFMGLSKSILLQMHDHMVKARVLEERLIKLYKTGDAYFWIGSPGEEAFGVPLGMLIHKGQGPEYDYLHLHYRGTPTLIAMGMDMRDSIRLQMNRSTDPSTGGRNFCNHYCFPQWNVVPVGSPIEVQYGMAVGTAIVQRRLHQKGSKGITVVTGGDAGTAEGDYASSLVWSSRPGQELPILITVQNNGVGISTNYSTQHGEKHIADRAKAFGIRSSVINGNDPVEVYLALQSEMSYIRKTGKPVMMEFMVSRLNGHSSATGANRDPGEDCLSLFEKKLVDAKYVKLEECKKLYLELDELTKKIADEVRLEPVPQPDSIWDHIYDQNENADWRKF